MNNIHKYILIRYKDFLRMIKMASNRIWDTKC